MPKTHVPSKVDVASSKTHTLPPLPEPEPGRLPVPLPDPLCEPLPDPLPVPEPVPEPDASLGY